MKATPLCESERLSFDIISTLPQPILETILCLLPTNLAARTSILSRQWRYKWTKIPKLEFCLETLSRKQVMSEQTSDITENMDRRFKLFYNLHQYMLQRQSPIHELTLNMGSDYDFLEFDQIILYLSRNHTIKKLKLEGLEDYDYWYELPVSIFSMHHLTDLELTYFKLDHPPTFTVFFNLQKLDLWYVKMPTKTLLHILSNSPSLKSFNAYRGGECDRDDKCTINELFRCMPVIEDLTIWNNVSEWLVLDSVPQELPVSLIHLKYFTFQEMCFVNGFGLAFLLVLIKCSPNLEKINLQIKLRPDRVEEYPIVWEDYSNVRLEHLNELKIGWFSNSMRDMEFLKFILARSPKLKNVSIRSWIHPNQESEMLKTFLEAPRVSPVVITVKSNFVIF